MELINEDLKQVFRSNPLYSQEGKYMEAAVIVKYFFPLSNATWLITEAEEYPNGDWLLFGYIYITEWEWRYVMLSELQNYSYKGILR
ncbi:DUF2958 domain-containing protein [Bacteroides ovatus]|uniref:DUF2958 domain-containing protein n=1 Tax=Bacteroides ovatus TaxID=28116 RepID=UPI00202E235A|nr:DUF2958 domain-containing protein [Bacteroides ovatus]MCM1723335.1 DUF2958 domain-containing protein [Bacteroides ovatus]MCM1757656.1 DUF2958 domain-containing protein [Bacteroides ovatus]MCM1869083.1 DUF2958 domain-containing protein [Bacteroides ovatus]MCM1912689.1 DUF2958 domain-containing protein [Bacteroides ovatus]